MANLGKLIAPKLTTAQRDAITSPQDAELVFNTTKDCYEFYDLDTATWKCMFSEGGDPIPPSEVGGGAASMILSFASGGEKHVSSTSPTYESLAHLIYAGSNVVGVITAFNINAWVSDIGTTDVRIVDLATGLTVVEVIGITSELESNVQNMGTITNLPTGSSVLEIQARKTTGGGSVKILIASLELTY